MGHYQTSLANTDAYGEGKNNEIYSAIHAHIHTHIHTFVTFQLDKNDFVSNYQEKVPSYLDSTHLNYYISFHYVFQTGPFYTTKIRFISAHVLRGYLLYAFCAALVTNCMGTQLTKRQAKCV